MVAFAQGNVSQIRNIALATVFVATLFFLFQSFHPTAHSIHQVSSYVPAKWHGRPPRITKVTSNLNRNELYERVFETHEAQDELHGYDMRIQRDRLSDGWANQAVYLLSIIVNELEKPEKQRTGWLLWFQPDVIVLNPRIPLEVFLPPEPEFSNVHFLATHDNHGELDSGVFFLRVHEWSAKLLVEVLTSEAPGMQQAQRKERFALSAALKGNSFRDSVYYQPRAWYNAYAMSPNTSEYELGDMQLHFHGMGGDKWSGMSQTLDLLSSTPSDFSVPLDRTIYPSRIDAYWHRITIGQRTRRKAEQRMGEPGVADAFNRLSYALNYEADNERVMQEAIDGLRDAMGVSNGEHAL